MNKYVLSFFFLLATLSVLGQKKSRVNLVSSTSLNSITNPNGSRTIRVHNGVFKQDYSTLTSDSAYFYPDLNIVDAFGHVIINQGDTVHIYSDKLNYNGNTKVALLTDHVMMVDKDATLTTNNFTYNTATRIGTYVDGGKLVNKDNTLTSKNGYYFAFTRDAYFRYDVVCKTPDAVINTDTMRYNSGTRINYFYGPTIIKGKDKDNLYTENGTYNTVLKQAAFGKKNLYTSQSKSLKGDSLFYDRLKGYGRAVKHVTFTDTEQRITIKGDFGEYFKSNDLAVVTENAYMIFVTEDSTSTAKPADSLKAATGKTDSLTKFSHDSRVKQLTGAKPMADSLLKHNKTTTDSVTKSLQKAAGGVPDKNLTLKSMRDSIFKNNAANKQLTLQGIKDSVIKQLPAANKANLTNKKTSQAKTATSTKKAAVVVPGAPAIKKPAPVFAEKTIPKLGPIVYKFQDTVKEKPEVKRPNIRYDSLFMAGDTFKTKMITYKDYKLLKQRQYELAHPDTTAKSVIAPVKKVNDIDNTDYTKPVKYIRQKPFSIVIDTAQKPFEIPNRKPDTNFRVFMYPKVISSGSKSSASKPVAPPAATTAAAKPASDKTKIPAPKLTAADSLRIKQKADSLEALRKSKEIPDTTRMRIINVYNNAKIFKSDLQAKADSMFYSSLDSTIRMYNKPMIWTQNSQLSGDTINLQMKNKKLDNLDMFPAAFIVNIEKNDSTHFNQAGGKFMHGTFKNGKLNSFTIIGNAETIYFKRDSVKNTVTDMSRTQSGKARFDFVNGDISSASFSEKYTARGIPIGKAKEEDRVLKGFIWKPKDRPASKESILSHRAIKPKTTGKTLPKTGSAKGKTTAKKPGATKAAIDTADIKSDVDTSAVVGKKDSLNLKPGGAKTDSLGKKPTLLKPASNKPGATVQSLKPANQPASRSTAQRDTVSAGQAGKLSRDTARRDTTKLKKLTPPK